MKPQSDTRINQILDALCADLAACEFKWTIFVAAARSYKFDSLLKPFPGHFVADNALDIDRLRATIDKVPRFNDLLHQLMDCLHLPNAATDRQQPIDKDLTELLYWCFNLNYEPKLRILDRNDFDSVLSKVDSLTPIPRPTHIYEVVSSPLASSELSFRKHAAERQVLFGYHGSSLDCFHSILSYGLQQHLCKNALFGEGIYLSSELHVSQMFSPISGAWKYSRVGDRISCIAICEFVNHPEHLKCQLNHNAANRKTKSAVPDKYFVITNNEIVRVRYIIAYGEHTNRNRANVTSTNPVVRWVKNNKAITAMALYAAILMAIGATNSRFFYYFKQAAGRASQQAFDYARTAAGAGYDYLRSMFQ